MHQDGGFRREFEALQEWEMRRKAMMEEAAEATVKKDQKLEMVNAENRYSDVVACEYRLTILNRLNVIVCYFFIFR